MASREQTQDAWQEMLDRALEGDVHQLGRLCQEYLRPKLYPFALSLLKNHADAEDVIQDAFTRLLTHSQNIRKRDLKGFEAFVMSMVKNLCRDLWKKRKATEPVPDNLQAATTPQEEAARQEVFALLCAIIQQEFTEAEQQLFELKVVQEITYHTISEQTGIPVTTLYHWYQKILLKLETYSELREYWEGI